MTTALTDRREALEFLGPRQVAELLGVSRLSVYRLGERGFLPVYRILRCLRFKRADIIEFLARNRTGAWRDESYGRPQD